MKGNQVKHMKMGFKKKNSKDISHIQRHACKMETENSKKNEPIHDMSQKISGFPWKCG